ncbi:MAG: short-chain dehydrogenase [Deltaproteobacteria bacterium]|nr:MAG: short-chain dehydrogenase [Deltaproteobacteria bacterium]
MAACRKASDELAQTGAEVVTDVDVTESAGAQRLEAAVGERPLDHLILNAGILEQDGLDNLDFDSIRRQFEVNSMGPLRVTSALLGRLGTGSKVAIITSRMGSIADNGSGGAYGYRMSKAAVNAAFKSLANDVADRGVMVAILHPGWVQTRMVGNSGNVTADESAAGLLARIDELTPETSGTFWHAEGAVLPW